MYHQSHSAAGDRQATAYGHHQQQRHYLCGGYASDKHLTYRNSTVGCRLCHQRRCPACSQHSSQSLYPQCQPCRQLHHHECHRCQQLYQRRYRQCLSFSFPGAHGHHQRHHGSMCRAECSHHRHPDRGGTVRFYLYRRRHPGDCYKSSGEYFHLHRRSCCGHHLYAGLDGGQQRVYGYSLRGGHGDHQCAAGAVIQCH